MIEDTATGRILVQHRLAKPTTPWCGLTFPGGHVEAGESISASIVREIREETGLTVSNLRMCGVVEWEVPEKPKSTVWQDNIPNSKYIVCKRPFKQHLPGLGQGCMLLASVLEGGIGVSGAAGTLPPQSSGRCPDMGGGRPPHGMRRPSVRVTCESAGRVSRPARPGRSGGSSTHVGGARRCGRRGGCQAWGGRPAATPRSRRRSPCRWPRSRRGRPSRRRRTRSPQRASSAAPHFTPEIHPERLCISISAGLRTI